MLIKRVLNHYVFQLFIRRQPLTISLQNIDGTLIPTADMTRTK